MNPGKSVPAQADKIFTLPNREAATQAQLNSLLGVFNMTSQFLIAARMQEIQQPEGGKMDGGAISSAEATIMKVCDKLDEIMDEKARWSLDTQLTLEKALTEAYTENANMLREQAAAYQEARSPHAQWKPKLFKLTETGQWVAIVGDLQDLDNSLVGLGDNPQQALEAFDELFRGQVPGHLRKLLEEHTNEQNKPVDKGTTKQPPADEPKRRFRRRYGNQSGPNTSSGEGTNPEVGSGTS